MNKLNSLNLNFVNFIFMFAGIMLHGNLKRYIDAFADSVKSCSGILLQFPFYAGIQGMMTGAVAGVSLAGVISTFFVGNRYDYYLPAVHFPQRGYSKLLCSFRRRSVGGSGSYNDACGT